MTPARHLSSSPTHFVLAAMEMSWPDWRLHPHYSELLAAIVQVEAAPCWLCGHAHPEMVRRRDRINEGFTNHAWAAQPRSEWLCLPCAVTVMSHPANRHFWRLNGHLATSAGLSHPTRSEWRGLLLEPPAPPFLIAIPTSRQKHLLFRASVATSPSRFPVQLEEESILVDGSFRRGLAAVEAAIAAGWRHQEIRTGAVNSRRMLDLGLRDWRELEKPLTKLRHTRLMELLLHVAHNPKEERCSDSQPMTGRRRPRRSSSTRAGAAETHTD